MPPPNMQAPSSFDLATLLREVYEEVQRLNARLEAVEQAVKLPVGAPLPPKADRTKRPDH
jgi:hypothetical protein